jgi:hypothetical protein
MMALGERVYHDCAGAGMIVWRRSDAMFDGEIHALWTF